MDRNSIIGLSLIMVIMVGYFFLTRENYTDIQAEKRRKDSIALVYQAQADSLMKKQKDSLAQVPMTAADSAREDSLKAVAAAPAGTFGNFATGTAELVTIENNLIKVTLNTKGGHVHSVELKNYKRAERAGEEEKQPLLLFDGSDAKFNLTFVDKQGFADSTTRLYFTPSAKKVSAETDSASLSMKVALGNDQYMEQVYGLKPDSYELYYTVNMKGLNTVMSPTQRFMQMNWAINFPLQEKSKDAELKTSGIYYRGYDDEVEDMGETSFEEEKPAASLQWISLKQQFFNSTLISLNNDGFSNTSVATAESKSPTHVKTARVSTVLPLTLAAEEKIPMKFYFGPNKYSELKKLDIGLDKLIPMGWGIFGWINKGMIVPLFNMLSKITTNFGVIILLMTLIIKALLFILVYRSYISSAKMRILKPEIDALKEKYGNELQKFQQEQMKLFKSAGVSPLGGCLPLLIQMPFLIAMFRFFPASIELRQASFLWAPDLSTYDSIWNFGHVPLISSIYGDHVSLFTLLMTVSTLIYTRFNNQLTGVTGQMKYIGYIMPVFFLGFFNNYAAGLTYYYFLTNIVSIGQQFIIRRFVDEDKLHAQIQENKKKPVKESNFQKRLAEMAKKRGMQQQPPQRGKKK